MRVNWGARVRLIGGKMQEHHHHHHAHAKVHICSGAVYKLDAIADSSTAAASDLLRVICSVGRVPRASRDKHPLQLFHFLNGYLLSRT